MTDESAEEKTITTEDMDGPHGPGCNCGDLPPEVLAALEELESILDSVIGNTPAETRTGVSDVEAALLEKLSMIRPLVDGYSLATAQIGLATGRMLQDPARSLARISEETVKGRRHYTALGSAVKGAMSLTRQLAGTRAVDQEGTPMWFTPGNRDKGEGWLTTAAQESPGEEWKALYTR